MLKKICPILLLLVSILIFLPNKTFAAVVINEVSPATNPEWIELYNTSPDSVSLQGYIIDFGSDSQKKSFCDNDQIAGNSYRAIILTAFWLNNNEGDTVTLKNGPNVIDSISYGTGTSLQKPSNTQSITRSPDGSPNWILTDVPTQQGDPVMFECPTPTPTPTNTPTPTKIPTPTKTPTPTKSPTSTPTPKPTSTPVATKSPTSKSTIAKTEAATAIPSENKNLANVLGSSSQNQPPQISETPKDVKVASVNSGNVIASIFIILGIVFLGLCGIVVFWSYKKSKNARTEE